MKSIDINCDMGESFGAYRMGHDEAILPYISSANIACGFHAGDPATMKKTVSMAMEKGVAIGAHPGLPDLQGFGRRNMAVSPEEVYDMVVYQIGALAAFAQAEGGKLHHVKPHGALYNMAAVSHPLSEAIAEAVYKVNPEAVLYGLAGSELVNTGHHIGLKVAHEVFADRTYQADGTLTPRSEANALITQPAVAITQVMRMVKEGIVSTQQGTDITIKADTICLHGDGTGALLLAKAIYEVLKQQDILIKTIGND